MPRRKRNAAAPARAVPGMTPPTTPATTKSPKGAPKDQAKATPGPSKSASETKVRFRLPSDANETRIEERMKVVVEGQDWTDHRLIEMDYGTFINCSHFRRYKAEAEELEREELEYEEEVRTRKKTKPRPLPEGKEAYYYDSDE